MTDIRQFVYADTPRGQERPRFARNGHAYKSIEAKAYEQCIREAYLRQYRGMPPMAGAFGITIQATFPRPKRCSREMPTVKPDLDNVCKAVLDALNGVAYTDDKNNVKLEALKRYGPRPGLYVRLEDMNEMQKEAQA